MISKTRQYTDAYGLTQIERIPVTVSITSHQSAVTRIAREANLHPEYLTPLGCATFMLRAIKQNQHSTAIAYRNAALRSSVNTHRLTRLWNIATMPKPNLP